jgi:hypothetical protein
MMGMMQPIQCAALQGENAGKEAVDIENSTLQPKNPLELWEF